MHVHLQATLGRNLAQLGDRGRAIGHRAFKMRDTAHHIHTHIKRADGIGPRCRVAVETVLREGDQLQVDVVLHMLAHLQQRLDPQQPVIAGIHMAADRQQPHTCGPVAIVQRARHHILARHHLLQLAPQANALQQCARGVDARQPVGQGRIHVKMRVYKGRADQITGGVDHFTRLHITQITDRRDHGTLDTDIGDLSIGQRAALDQQIEHQRSPLLNGTISTAGTSARRDITTSARMDRI